jgi:dihydroxyacid dehydratase/phosphogluconate dehydratase
MDLLAAGHRGAPAAVIHQVGCDELKPGVVGAAAASRRPQIILPDGRAHGGAHRASVSQQAGDQLHRHVPGSTRDKDPAHAIAAKPG